MMRSWSYGLVLSLVLLALLASSPGNHEAWAKDKRAIIAVMDIEDSSDTLKKSEIRTATEYIRGRLTATGQFIVIDKSRQAAALKKLIKDQKKDSYKECRAKECQIPLGQALSADKVLRTGLLFLGGVYTLQSELIDLSKEASVGGAAVDFRVREGAKVVDSMTGALRKLVQQLVGGQGAGMSIGMGVGVGAAGAIMIPDAEVGADLSDDDWSLESSKTSLVRFQSDPPGAQVWVDGKSLGIPQKGKSFLTRKLPAGQHRVEMLLPMYQRKTVPVTWTKSNEEVRLSLDPDFALLEVQTEPPGIPVFINDDLIGTSPITGYRLVSGPHELRLEDSCHYPYSRNLNVIPGTPVRIQKKFKAKMAAVEVDARFGQDDIEATLWVDGRELGPTPGPYKVPLCSQEARVVPEDPKLAPWSSALELRHKEIWRKSAQVTDHAYIRRQTHRAEDDRMLLEKAGAITYEFAYIYDRNDHGLATSILYKPLFFRRYLRLGFRLNHQWGYHNLDQEEVDAILEQQGDSEDYELSHKTVGLSGILGLEHWGRFGAIRVQRVHGTYWETETLTGAKINNKQNVKNLDWRSSPKRAWEVGLSLPAFYLGGHITMGFDDDTGKYLLVGLHSNGFGSRYTLKEFENRKRSDLTSPGYGASLAAGLAPLLPILISQLVINLTYWDRDR